MYEHPFGDLGIWDLVRIYARDEIVKGILCCGVDVHWLSK